MGYTNTTAHYNLPQYVSTDVPSILGDVNDAYAAIDGAIYAAAEDATDAKSDAASAVSAVSAAQADATQALADALAAQTDATTALTNAATAQTTANGAVTAAGTAQTTANGAVTLLGNTALPTGQTTVTGAIDALDKSVNKGYASATADTGETETTVLNRLFTQVDFTKINEKSVLVRQGAGASGKYVNNLLYLDTTAHSASFTHNFPDGNGITSRIATIANNAGSYKQVEATTSGTITYTDLSSNSANGATYILIY